MREIPDIEDLQQAVDEALVVAVEEALQRWRARDATESTEQTRRMVEVYERTLAQERRSAELKAQERRAQGR